jgi:hypothetical protein
LSATSALVRKMRQHRRQLLFDRRRQQPREDKSPRWLSFATGGFQDTTVIAGRDLLSRVPQSKGPFSCDQWGSSPAAGSRTKLVRKAMPLHGACALPEIELFLIYHGLCCWRGGSGLGHAPALYGWKQYHNRSSRRRSNAMEGCCRGPRCSMHLVPRYWRRRPLSRPGNSRPAERIPSAAPSRACDRNAR